MIFRPHLFYIFLLSFLLSPFFLLPSFAQQSGGARPGGGQGGQMPDLGSLGAVVGSVVDESKQPVQYATVFVMNPQDSTTVTGGITDENGRIVIIDIPWGTYIAQVNAMGYSKHFTPEFTLIPANPRYMMRQFAVTQRPQQLKGLEVTTQKEMLQQNLDKKVYNVENSIVTDGGTAVQALAEIPSVDVDIEGNVSLRGTGNVTILVDGRPTNLTLDQIPASEIESIEVITNPSARLEPDGMGGVINVILKKRKQPGFNAYFTGGMSTLVFKNKLYMDGGNLSMNLNYTYNKVTMFLNYNFRTGQWRNANELERTTWFQRPGEMHTDSTYLSQSTESNGRWFGNNVRAGLDYFINKQNTLSFTFGYNRNESRDTSFLTATNLRWMFDEKQPFNSYEQNGRWGRHGNNFSGNVSYKKTFDKQGMELTSDVYYTEMIGQMGSQYLQQFTLPEALPDYFQKTKTESRNRTATGQVDFITPVGNGGRIETGYKLSYRSIYQDYRLHYGNSYSDYQENKQQRNNFQYQELINSAYFIYSNSFWKVLKVQLGLRGEFANTYSQLFPADSEPKTYSRNYLKLKNILYPTLHVRYDVNDYHSLQLSFSRRVTRPSFWNLNPFVDISDKQNLRMGNPDLGPEFANNLELGYFTNIKKSSFSATVFYRHRTDLITRYTQMRQAYIRDGFIYYTLIDDEILRLPIEDNFLGTDTFTYTLTSTQNLNSSQSIGFELVYGQRLFNFWRLNFSGDCYYVKINSDDLIDPNLSDDWAFGFRLNQTFNLPKSWDIQLNFRFRSRSITTGSMGGWFGGGVGQGRRNAQYSLNCGVKKSFLKNNAMSVSLNIRDLIYNPKTIIHSYDRTQTTSGYDSYSTRWRSSFQMNLTVTYRLNNYKQRREPTRDVDAGEPME
ncbi:MAG: TonB-dependent receptor [Bacteroidetes bacterium]|nr:TonB-dependent receptor [Bacteroidota bacterium]MCL2302706.1 TonB-dependent receptor [Lentimicrobiaceae bacterium]